MSDFNAPQQQPWYDQQYVDYLLQPQAPPIYGMGLEAVDDFGGYATDLRKAPTLAADQAFLISQGLTRPEMFQPVTTAEPVETPGYNILQDWSADTATPFQQWVAARLPNMDSATIIGELQRLMTEADPQADPVIGSMPRQFKQNPDGTVEITELPDLQIASNEIRDLESMLQSDPEFELIDGRPMATTTEDSQWMEKLVEMGYSPELGEIPGQPYDPYALAMPGQYERDQATVEARDASREERDDMLLSYQRALGDTGMGPTDAYLTELPPWMRERQREMYAEQDADTGASDGLSPFTADNTLINDPSTGFERALQTGSEVGGNVLDYLDFSELGGVASDVVGGAAGAVADFFTGPSTKGSLGPTLRAKPPDPAEAQAMARYVFAPQQGPGGTSMGTSTRATSPQRNTSYAARPRDLEGEKRRRTAGQAYRSSVSNSAEASDNAFAAELRYRALQDLSNQLAAQGRTPFDDRRNQINQAIYGRFG